MKIKTGFTVFMIMVVAMIFLAAPVNTVLAQELIRTKSMIQTQNQDG